MIARVVRKLRLQKATGTSLDGSLPAPMSAMASTEEERNHTTITYVGEGRWSATIISPEGSAEIESDSMEDLIEYARVARVLLTAPAIGS